MYIDFLVSADGATEGIIHIYGCDGGVDVSDGRTVAAWLRAAAEAPEGAAWLVSWV